MKVWEFWSDKYGQNVIKNSIGIRKYKKNTQFLCFDCRETRNRMDKLAPIRIIWDMFIENCIKHYKLSKQVTVDEQLVTF